MPTGEKIYSSTNTIGTNTKYTKGTVTVAEKYEGLCKALAVLWCEKMVNGKRDILTEPDQFRAGALQFKFEISWDSDVIFGLADLKSTDTTTRSPRHCLNYIAHRPGTYQIRVPGHAIAVHASGGIYYFYDSESGLWRYTSKDQWRSDILAEYKDKKDWTIWKLERK